MVVASVIGLIEVADPKRIWRIQRWEFWLSMACFAGVAGQSRQRGRMATSASRAGQTSILNSPVLTVAPSTSGDIERHHAPTEVRGSVRTDLHAYLRTTLRTNS